MFVPSLTHSSDSSNPERRSPGCLDSLVYYKRLLVSLLASDDSTLSEREKINLECLGMVKKLEQVDPMRRQRYSDLGELASSAYPSQVTDNPGTAGNSSCADRSISEVMGVVSL